MAFATIIWDLEDDEDGNYWHIVVEGHGVSVDEVEEVLLDNRNQQDVISRTSGNPITFGWTSAGQYIAVVWELVSDDPKAIYPLTAYPVPPPG
jgi:hypothetical protein